jgi:DNA-binding CsgD family transcriptional regulator
MRLPADSDSLVRSIYDAALDDDAWSRLAGVLVDYIGADSGVIHYTDGAVLDQSNGFHAQATLDAYADHYRTLDPFFEVVVEHGLFARAFHGSELVPDLTDGEFYHDFLRQARILPTIGAIFPIGAGGFGSIGLHRPPGASDFREVQKARLQSVLGHLSQMLVLRRQLREQRRTSAVTSAALDYLSAGVIVCDANGKVLFANAAAEALSAGHGGIVLRAEDHVIGGESAEQSLALRGLIAQVASGGPGGALCLRSRDDTRLLVVVSPLPSTLGDEGQRVLVSLRSEAGQIGIVPDMLISLFGLTVAEADLSWSLMQNHSLHAIQQRRGVSENTVRTQLAHVLAKTGTANQRELVRLMAMVPAA